MGPSGETPIPRLFFSWEDSACAKARLEGQIAVIDPLTDREPKMVRLVASLFLILPLAQTTQGQTLTANPEKINLGKIGRGWSGEAEWSLTNTGANPVQILEIRSGCNCVEAKAEKNLLSSGASTKIRAHIRTLSQTGGKSSWKVTILFQHPDCIREEPKTLALLATAELVADLRIEPTIISFKGAGPGQSQLTIFDERSPPIRILKTTTNIPAITTRWVENGIPGNQSLLIMKKQGPPMRGFVVLETDDPTRPRIEIPIHIEETLTNLVEVSPTKIQWNPSGNCRMILSRPGDLLLRVEKVEVPEGVTVGVIRGPGPRATLEFKKVGQLASGSKAVVIFEKKELGKLVIDLE